MPCQNSVLFLVLLDSQQPLPPLGVVGNLLHFHPIGGGAVALAATLRF